MFEDEIKKLNIKRKHIVKNLEILDKKMKRGRISVVEYLQQFDKQKKILSQIKQKIKQLEHLKEQKLDLKELEEIEEKKDVFDIEKTEEYLPEIENYKLEKHSNASKIPETKYYEELPTKKHVLNSGKLRQSKFFKDDRLKINLHPNMVHLSIRNILESLGYRILEMSKPSSEMLDVEEGKFKIFDFTGYLIGSKKAEVTESQNSLSIYILEEGVCSIAFDGKQVITETQTQISLAGNSNELNDTELKKDIDVIIEKINTLS